MTQWNKLGQKINRRGAETRARLLASALQLLQITSPLDLEAQMVARAAGMSPAAFYTYFTDVKELILTLSDTAAKEQAPVVLLLTSEWNGAELRTSIERFVEAYYRYGTAHRSVIVARNILSDLGDERFYRSRYDTSLDLLNPLTDHIVQNRKTSPRPIETAEAWSLAIVWLMAFDPIFIYPTKTYIASRPTSLLSIMRAQVDLLLSAMGGGYLT